MLHTAEVQATYCVAHWHYPGSLLADLLPEKWDDQPFALYETSQLQTTRKTHTGTNYCDRRYSDHHYNDTAALDVILTTTTRNGTSFQRHIS